jgi:DNA-binding MurR/RpiR family transcriptional regulator
MRMGMNAEAQQDAHIIAMTAALAGDQDVVFGISTSGGTVDLVEAFRRAKKNGATTIALTANGESALASVSDITLLVPSKEMPLQGGSFSTKIAQMNLLDVLLTLVTMELKDTAYDSIKITAKAVVDRMV